MPDRAAPAPASAPANHPNLQLALARLRRLQWLWAVLFAALGGLTLAATRGRLPTLALTWVALAALLVGRPQPMVLAVVAIGWGASMVFLVPGVQPVLGSDPIAALLSSGPVENAAQALVRLLLLITAWNQFLFYRLLYGTGAAAGLDRDLAPIPEVVPNPSDAVAPAARLLGFAGLMAALAAVPLAGGGAGPVLLGLSFGTSIFAVGLGLGSAFVPTRRRPMALAGIVLGVISMAAGLMVGRALYG